VIFDLQSNAEYAISWLKTKQLDFFDHDPRKWIGKTNVATRSFVYSMDQVLLTHWLGSALSAAPAEPLAYLRHVVAFVREVFINQRQMRGDIFEGFHDGHFWMTTFTRLWRGHVNCEGQNHLLMILLRRRFSEVELFETIDPKTHRARHSLVVFSWAGRRVFADAWSDIPLFHLQRDWKDAPSDIVDFGDLEKRGYGERQGVQPRITYEMGRIVPIPRLWPWMDSPLRDWNMPEAAEGTVRPHEPGFGEYLEARSHHIWGRRDDALRGYEQVRRMNAGSPVARAAALFAERLGKNQTARSVRSY